MDFAAACVIDGIDLGALLHQIKWNKSRKKINSPTVHLPCQVLFISINVVAETQIIRASYRRSNFFISKQQWYNPICCRPRRFSFYSPSDTLTMSSVISVANARKAVTSPRLRIQMRFQFPKCRQVGIITRCRWPNTIIVTHSKIWSTKAVQISGIFSRRIARTIAKLNALTCLGDTRQETASVTQMDYILCE